MRLDKSLKNVDHSKDLSTAQGFERIYRDNVKKLCRIAYNQLRDESLAQSIVHNVFCSLWERRNQIEIKDSVDGYLVRAVKLSVFDHIRTKMSHRVHMERSLQNTCYYSEATEDQVHFNELAEKARYLVKELPRQCQNVYKLSRERGMTNKEIASFLQIAEKTVEAHLTKALKFLRSRLADYRL